MTDLLTESFRFGFSQFGTVLKCLLVPYILMIVGLCLVFIGLIDFGSIEAMDYVEEPESLPEFLAFFDSMLRLSLGGSIVLLVVGAVIVSLPYFGGIASIFRVVGMDEEPRGWFHLRFDGPMWRTFFAYFIMMVLQWVIYLIAFAIAFAMNPDMFAMFGDLENIDNNPELLLSFMGSFFLIFFISLIVMMVVFTKLAPFPAASACENRLMLINSWTRTKGHAWTILAGYILLILALIAAQIGFQIFTSVLQGLFGVLTAMGVGMAGVVGVIGILILIASIFFGLFTTGVQMAFPAVIYRYLWNDEQLGD